LFLQYQGERPFTDVAPYYLRALQLAPESRTVFDHLVTPWLMHKEYGEIIAKIGPVAVANPQITRLQLVYVDALKATKDTERAISHLRNVLERTDWADPVVLRELSVCLWREQKHDDVRALLREARRKKALRGSFVLAHAEAMFYNAMASSDEVKAEGERAVEKMQERALKAARRAVDVAQNAEREADLESLGQVLATGEAWNDLLVLTEKAEGKVQGPDVLILKLKALEQLGRLEEAIRLLEAMKKQDDIVHPYILAEMARLYLKAERPEEAAQYFEQTLLKAPRSIPIRLQLAYLYLTTDQPRKGLATLIPLEELPPQGHLLMAHLYRELGRNTKAYDALVAAEAEAVKMEDKQFLSTDFRMFCASVCEDLGKTDEAIVHARKARELAPDDPMIANFLGYVLADHNMELEQAEILIRQAVKAEPENVAYLDSLAWVLYRQERFPEALKAMNRALTFGRNESDPVILDHAGDIYAANGLTILSRHFWLQAIERGALRPDEIRAKTAAVGN
jgi:tetratricopeptide (TPR) repeat protein